MKFHKNSLLKLLAIAVALLCVFALPQTAQAASESDLTLTENESGDSCRVYSCRIRASGEMVIPATYNGLPVTAIGREGFSGCIYLTNVVIPYSVTSIGYRAFYNCREITSITMPNSITTIEACAFQGCTKLASMVIPSGVTELKDRVFYDCNGLTTIAIPSTVTTIGTETFGGCGKLSTVIYCGAQDQWDAITKGNYNGPLTKATLQLHNYENDTCTYCGEGNKSILTFALNDAGDAYTVTDCSESAVGELVIPDTYNDLPVTGIGDQAFQSCKALTGIVLPKSIVGIGYQAFEGCDNLKYNINNNCKYLGSAYNPYFALVAAETQDITECSVHPQTKIIAAAAFYGCKSLRSAAISFDVTHIGYGAFYGCTGLTSVYMPGEITAIGDFAFAGCTSLLGITIPASVTYIGAWAFNQCSALTSFTLPSGITAISEGMLAMCSSLTEISVPSSVTTIGSNAFNGCTALKNITIPKNVTTIGDGAFVWCSRLSNINIPGSVTSIGQQVFANCKKLETVTYCGTQEQWKKVQVAADNDALSAVQFHNFENGKCTYCQAAEGVSCNHNWKDADCENPKTCTLCKETEGTALGHKMQETAKVEPTCETSGQTAASTCANCSKTEGGEEIPAIGHDMKETSAAVAATCETAGKTAAFACANCGKTEGGEEILATGHWFENGVCAACGYVGFITGDLDGNKTIDQDDVVYLLLHTLFGDGEYPLDGADGDVDGNGSVEREDVVYLLLHTMFGETYYPFKKD